MTAAVQPLPSEADCYHCGLPVPSGPTHGARVDGEWRVMCCPGCAAVAETIAAQGLEAYYRQREAPARRAPDESVDLPFEIFDAAELQREFVRDGQAGSEATFSLEGMRCAACAWLIERHLRRVAGVLGANVNLANHRVIVRFDPDAVRVSGLLRAVREVGYVAHPYEADREAELHEQEKRAALVRLGVSGLGTMQVMMFAVALYAGALEGMSAPYRELLRWVSLLVATFVVTIGARPFFEAAARDLRAWQLGMDVPVSLAIGLAYVASAWATFAGTGEVYFDSVCMFTFFLSLGRFLESRVRHASDARIRALARRTPASARRIEAGAEHIVPVRDLQRGDFVAVRPGEAIPLDGRVVEGESAVSEGMWTGEDAPRRKCVGDPVIGGSQNLEAALCVRVERGIGEGALATIRVLLDRAQSERPPVARLADRVARVFVGVVLGVAAVTAVVWWRISPGDALGVTLAVLVATCPCALSLATPAALAAATDALAAVGFLATRGHVLEVLARVSRFAFDKTGTLTARNLEVESVVPVRGSGWDPERVLATAAQLERESLHPIAAAFPQEESGADGPVERREEELSQGVGARVGGRRLRLGRPEWVGQIADLRGRARVGRPPEGRGSWILMGGEDGPIAWIALRSRLRAGAAETLAGLRARGVGSFVLSGDPSEEEVARVARLVGADEAHGGQTPEAKVAIVGAHQDRREVVAAVGDGSNDAPLLGRAQVSIAMASGTDLARVSADAVLMGDRLPLLCAAVDRARWTRRVVRQNLGWAALYNAFVLPLAVTGHLPPYLAALGMSASSLAVVLNALRLRRPIDLEALS